MTDSQLAALKNAAVLAERSSRRRVESNAAVNEQRINQILKGKRHPGSQLVALGKNPLAALGRLRTESNRFAA
jgi:hypothetical protein